MTDIRNNYQTQNLQGNVNWTMTAAYHIHYHPPHTHCHNQIARLMRHKNTTHTTQKYRSHTTHTQPALYITQWNG